MTCCCRDGWINAGCKTHGLAVSTLWPSSTDSARGNAEHSAIYDPPLDPHGRLDP